MGSQWFHDRQEKSKFLSFRLHRIQKVAGNIQSWWDLETYGSKINSVSQSKKEQWAKKFLESTTEFTGERYVVGMLWSEPGSSLPNNYGSVLGQL